MHTIVEPFQFGFFRHGIAVATLAGGLCGLVGVYVVLRGMSYIGHGLSHAILGVTNHLARVFLFELGQSPEAVGDAAVDELARTIYQGPPERSADSRTRSKSTGPAGLVSAPAGSLAPR